MLEGTIKLHGNAGSGKTRLLQKIEEVLRHSDFADLRIVCKTQLPGQPEEHEVTFKKPVGDAGKLQANWTRR